MSDAIGKFVVDLEARMDRFESDMGRAARIAQQTARAQQKYFEDSFAKIEEAAHRGTEGIMEALNALTGLNPAQLGLGAIAAGLGEVTKKAIETADQFNKMSQKTGIGVAALSGIAYAANLADVETGDLGTSLEKLAKNVAAAANGSAEQAAAFNAIGVSIKNTNGTIKPLDEILGAVANKFAGYKDGVEKTALAQALLGKSGAALIPLLNAGAAGIAKSSAEAKALGYNFVDIAQKSEDFNDNLTRLSKAAVGLGADIARELLPMLIGAEEKFLDFIKAARENGYLQDFAAAIKAVVANLDTLAVILGARLAINAAVAGFTALTGAASATAAAVALLEGVLGLLGGTAGVLAIAAGVAYYLASREDIATTATNSLKEAQDRLQGATNLTREAEEKAAVAKVDLARKAITATEALIAQAEALANQDTSSVTSNFGEGASLAANSSAIWAGRAEELKKELSGLKTKLADTNREMSIAAAITDLGGDAAKRAAPNVSNLGAAQETAAKAAERLQGMFAKDAEQLAKLQGQLDPVTKIYQTYVGTIEAAQKQYDDEIDAAKKAGAGIAAYAQAKANAIQKTAAAQAALKAETTELLRQNDVVGNYLRETAEAASTVGLDDRQKQIAEAVNKATEAWLKLNPAVRDYEVAMGNLDPTTEAGKRAIESATGALYDLGEEFKNQREVAQQWSSLWEQAANSVVDQFAKIIVEGGSLMDGLKDIAKQTVEAIIAYFAKLAIINPILNQIFGGSAGWSSLPSMVGSIGSAVAGGSGGGLLDFSTSAGGGTANSIMNPSSWITAGKNLWSGFQGGFSNLLSTDAYTMGPPTEAGSTSSFSPGYSNGFGQALGVAGGVYAGYNEFNRAGGGVAGLAGAAAYGVGTYFAGAAASAALSGGIAAGMAAIPVVGWIALAAMLIDKFSGGKLFGTAATFNGAQSDLRVSDTGAQYVSWADLKGQHALFGGSYHETQNIDATQDQIDSANAFFKALKDGTDQFARYFGTTAATIVGGTFSTVFDKKGNVKSTSSTVNGITYAGETAQQFTERLTAENDIAILKQVGVDVTGYTNTLIKDADAYLKGVQDVANAMGMAFDDLKNHIDVGGKGTLQGAFDTVQQYNTDGESQTDTYSRLHAELADVQNGVGLLTGQKTIADIEAFLATAQNFGETLSQTYYRLEQASAAYYQFVGQFKVPTTYVDDFEASLASINNQMQANIKQANDLAKAAGASGASIEDLVNIQKWAIAQQNALIDQLKKNAQSLAFSSGLSNIGTLDQVNDEIARLTGISNGSANAVHGFGGAMQSAARAATDAMDLLLGDLSPLNDQEKLQRALQGFYQGNVTSDQVLQIGRRLYATGAQYTALFNQVMSAAGRISATGGGGGGGSGSSSQSSRPLTAAEQARLDFLKREQPQLQAQQDYANAQTYAQQVAEIAMATGEGWQDVLKDQGVKLSDLEKQLHLDSDDQLKAYFDNIQKQQDSDGQNTATIVEAINELPQEIANALNRLPIGQTGHSQQGNATSMGYQVPPISPLQHSRHGRPSRLAEVG